MKGGFMHGTIPNEAMNLSFERAGVQPWRRGVSISANPKLK